MIDIVLTLVFMMVFIGFAIWPAIKIVDFIKSKKDLNEKKQNVLLLFFTIIIAFCFALFMKLA